MEHSLPSQAPVSRADVILERIMSVKSIRRINNNEQRVVDLYRRFPRSALVRARHDREQRFRIAHDANDIDARHDEWHILTLAIALHDRDLLEKWNGV